MNRDQLLEKLLASRNYRGVCRDTIQRIYDECLQKYKKPKDAEKAARERLHGITGAFMKPEEASACRERMREYAQAMTGQRDMLLEAMLRLHSSTRERLPLADMDALYTRLFSVTGAPERILDLACGINPIYLGARGIPCLGVDIGGEAIALIKDFTANCAAPLEAHCRDLLCAHALPAAHFSHVLMMKLLPVLERQRSGAARELLTSLDCDWAVVSFPTRTLSGRNVGMEAHYGEWMERQLSDNFAIVDRFTHGSEMFYVLKENRKCASSMSSPRPSAI